MLRLAAVDWLAAPVPRRTQLLDDWASRDLASLVTKLGYTVQPRPDPRMSEPWRGQWDDIAWAVAQIGRTHSPMPQLSASCAVSSRSQPCGKRVAAIGWHSCCATGTQRPAAGLR